MAEHNDLCSCGSGNTYKNCCGLKSNEKQLLPDAIAINRRLAYHGTLGEQRATFCQAYIAHKQAELKALAHDLRQDVSSRGKSITCGKGCTPCCHVYVVATLQECEAIVYYLYRHEVLLQHFLASYTVWRQRIQPYISILFKISELQNKRMAHLATSADEQSFDAALIAYASQDNPCPFLLDGACSIYEVRPYVCAGLVSTTPQAWCKRGHPYYEKVELVKAEVLMDDDMPYFASANGKVALTCMPLFIHEILWRGWEFLGDVPGLEHLKQQRDELLI
jgi:hypothetical protein